LSDGSTTVRDEPCQPQYLRVPGCGAPR
jgi:hypothetical protein